MCACVCVRLPVVCMEVEECDGDADSHRGSRGVKDERGETTVSEVFSSESKFPSP